MRHRHQVKTSVFILAASFCLAFLAVAKGPNSSPPPSEEALDLYEEIHLKFMRAEEKLAHDVYKYLDNYLDAESSVYPFANIVESESNHVGSMADKLRIYGLEDINEDDAEGEFHLANYGEYFLEKYTLLTELGEEGHLQALLVGGLIEELDMHDIKFCPQVIQDEMYIGEYECGMEYTDEELLKDSYGNIYAGSEKHLRAFAGAIVLKYANTPDYPYPCYKAQYLSQDVVNAILDVECIPAAE
ncbi:MAG: DUF2202 domain-containing protein [Desulfobulbaceae bacterium]|nr:DUF2202 domain-containing protein [Desulfobulbaceae bacterium]